MLESPIYLLRILRRINTKIDGHFILKKENKFMVFTSEPLKEVKCHLVSQTNIKGQAKPQYIAEKIHTFDPKLHTIKSTAEGDSYYAKEFNKTNLQPYEFKLTQESKMQLITEIIKHQ